MQNKIILIVEDEVKLANVLSDYLLQAQYVTHSIHHGDQVLDWLKYNHADLILLDIMLPGEDGISLCRELRKTSNIPIIMQSARIDEIDRLLGLEIGADDYICKPYSPKEVVARVKAVLRRSQYESKDVLNSLLQLDESRLKITFEEKTLELTAVEFQLLKALYDYPGQIFSRDKLIQKIYQDHRVVSDRTVDSHIKKLRKKLSTLSHEYEFIYSVYGAGYKFEL